MIGILNYGVGNIRSVLAALEASCGVSAKVIGPSDSLGQLRGMIIPGVGAFSIASEKLSQSRFLDALSTFWERGGKTLGICLGMQILFEWGMEGKPSAGLGVFRGTVEPIMPQPGERLPNMGWRHVSLSRWHPLFAQFDTTGSFYFCHSFRCVSKEDEIVLARTSYGQDEFVAAVAHKGVVGVQFHPEKSGERGLALLRNFHSWCREESL